ncbi:hypothetical protein E2C01_061903 [Portunus trituberculatus]|uniref:Uncharacterized protein n=1 Tax=Portunus trituberculatus TaxID=210409 RepID=A0A5B7H534_PORTR|nr:hypothetical protein [Portunus trituberculatus]
MKTRLTISVAFEGQEEKNTLTFTNTRRSDEKPMHLPCLTSTTPHHPTSPQPGPKEPPDATVTHATGDNARRDIKAAFLGTPLAGIKENLLGY